MNAFQLPLPRRQFVRKPTDLLPRRTDVIVGRFRCPLRKPCPCRVDHVIDHHANLFAHQLADQRLAARIRIFCKCGSQRSAMKGNSSNWSSVSNPARMPSSMS